MVKQKIAAIAASVLAVCSISATAFATTNGVPKYDFGPRTITAGGTILKTDSHKKEDSKSAWVRVDHGLSSGDTFATFQVNNASGTKATDPKELWVNSEIYIPYLSGQGVEGHYYYLKYYMEPQGNANSLYIGGVWAP